MSGFSFTVQEIFFGSEGWGFERAPPRVSWSAGRLVSWSSGGFRPDQVSPAEDREGFWKFQCWAGVSLVSGQLVVGGLSA